MLRKLLICLFILCTYFIGPNALAEEDVTVPQGCRSLTADEATVENLSPGACHLTISNEQGDEYDKYAQEQREGEKEPFPIVGIGVSILSARSLDAFEDILLDLPKDTGMAYIVVQRATSESKEIIRASAFLEKSKIPIIEVKGEIRLEPDHLYIVSPEATARISEGVLKLVSVDATSGNTMPMDNFFSSLAEEKGPDAIGVILPGKTADGTVGLRDIKERGGIVIVEDKRMAEYERSLLRNIASGKIDYVLSPRDIAGKLTWIGQRHKPKR